MYNILLVDDEPIVRLQIRTLDDWSHYGYEIAFEAQNGLEAIEWLDQPGARCDVLLTDISMPKMSGIELIQKVREVDKHIPIIVLSSYNDFQYVRDAFKLGVQDYVLKSELTSGQLLKLLQKAAETIADTHRSKMVKLDNLSVLAHSLLQDSLNGIVPENIKEKINTYELRLSACNIIIALFSIDDFRLLGERHGNEVLIRLNNSVLAIFSQKLKEYGIGEYVSLKNGIFAVIASFEDEKSSLRIMEKFNTFISAVKESLSQMLNISVTVGVSSINNGYDSIPMLFKQAQNAMALKLIYGKGKVIHQHDIKSIPAAGESSAPGMESKLLQAIESADNDRIRQELKQLSRHIVSLEPSNLNAVYDFYLQLIYSVLYHFSKKDIKPEDVFGKEVNFYDRMTKFETIDEINVFIENITMYLAEEIREKSENIPARIKKAKEYMKAHFHENISLKLVSDHLQISETYLSTLFTKEIGESFISYLTRLRIDKAKELLKTTNMTINEISECVGYYNQEHFSRIFKKHESVSPNKFRNS